MSRSVVALWTAVAADRGAAGDAAEFLRLALAALAAGAAVQLFDLRPASARAAPADADSEQSLAALVEGGARCATDPRDLRTALLGADSVLCLAAPDRAGAPPLLALTTSWLRTVAEHELVSALSVAGQVVRC